MKTRILLVDDQRMVRRGLRLLAELESDFTVVGEASNGPEALTLARELRPEVVVMDIHLPEMDGLEVSRLILKEWPQTKIVIVSGDADIQLVNLALQTGLAGYILKEGIPEELPRAIRAAREGRTYLSPEVTELVLREHKRNLGGTVTARPALSEQERAVLRLLAQGARTKEVAASLNISVKTVETYRRRMTQKLGCRSIAELTHYAIREGIVSL